MIFLMKPILYIKYDEIDHLIVQRAGISNKLFDLLLVRKDSKNKGLCFVGIDKRDLDIVEVYFKGRGISIMEGQDELGIKNDSDYEDDDGIPKSKSKSKNGSKSKNIIDDEDEDDDESFRADGLDDNDSG